LGVLIKFFERFIFRAAVSLEKRGVMLTTKTNWVKVFLAGLVALVISQIIHTMGAFLNMRYYLMEEYSAVWSKIMMPAAGPPPTSFYAYSVMFGFVNAFLFAFAYSIFKDSVPGRGVVKKGLAYGFLIFLVAGIPATLSMILLINLPQALIWSWTAEGLITFLAGGITTAWLVK
jgi:hypothetical protein